MRKSLTPFKAAFAPPQRKSVGGARPVVQGAAEHFAHTDMPMAVARIYSPPSLQMYDDSDPRFEGKSNTVENLYLAPVEKPAPRSGLAQAWNWLLTGRME